LPGKSERIQPAGLRESSSIMSSAQFSVRWVHRNPVLVTGFVNTAVEWLAVIFQIISDGRFLKSPTRSFKPKHLGLSREFEWVDRDEESDDLVDFWNDILCPAAVSEESVLYSTSSRWLSQFPWWPGPLAIADFRALMIAPWLARNFQFKTVVLVPNGHMFANDMYQRRKSNQSYIRLEQLEPLVKKYPQLCPVDFELLVAEECTTAKFAAAYAILNKWYELEAQANDNLLLFPYDALARHSYEAIEDLSETLDLRRRKKVSEALKAVRISFNGETYQNIPHSPKDPEGWRASLHPGQVQAIEEILGRMNCPFGGVANWSMSEEQLKRLESEKRGRSRRRRSGDPDDQVPRQAFEAESEEPEHASRIEPRASKERRERRSSRRGGRSSGGSSSRSRRSSSRPRRDGEDSSESA